jgi:hypothetical protein
MSRIIDLKNAGPKPLDFNAIFEDDTAPVALGPAARLRSWSAITKRTHTDLEADYKQIEANYKQGDRSEETKRIVCAWITSKAAKRVAKGRGKQAYAELFSAGYPAALAKWDALISDYDPAKDKGGGLDAPIFKAAEGAMRNAAAEMANRLNKRKHSKDQVLPQAETFDEEAYGHAEYGQDGRTSSSRTSDDKEDDSFSNQGGGPLSSIRGKGPSPTLPADVKLTPGEVQARKEFLDVSRVQEAQFGAIFKQSVGRGGRRAGNGAPRGASGRRESKQARDSTELHINTLLAPLPAKEQQLIRMAWGLDGVRKATAEQMAKFGGCSVSTVYSRLNKLYSELAQIAAERRDATNALREKNKRRASNRLSIISSTVQRGAL